MFKVWNPFSNANRRKREAWVKEPNLYERWNSLWIFPFTAWQTLPLFFLERLLCPQWKLVDFTGSNDWIKWAISWGWICLAPVKAIYHLSFMVTWPRNQPPACCRVDSDLGEGKMMSLPIYSFRFIIRFPQDLMTLLLKSICSLWKFWKLLRRAKEG